MVMRTLLAAALDDLCCCEQHGLKVFSLLTFDMSNSFMFGSEYNGDSF